METSDSRRKKDKQKSKDIAARIAARVAQHNARASSSPVASPIHPAVSQDPSPAAPEIEVDEPVVMRQSIIVNTKPAPKKKLKMKKADPSRGGKSKQKPSASLRTGGLRTGKLGPGLPPQIKRLPGQPPR